MAHVALPSRKPSLVRTESMPVIPIYRQTQRKIEIDAILAEHAYGNFYRAAPFVDEIMTDDRIAGVVETRIGALMSSELEIAPATDRRAERKLAERLGGIDGAKGLWSSICPPHALFELLKWGLLLGVGIAEIVWDRSDAKEWMPRVVPWHPQHLRWDWDRRRYVVQTRTSTEVVLPDLDENPEGDGRWFVWAPRGLQYGWLNGMIRSLAAAYIGRSWNFRDWARYNEKHGMGIMKADVPSWAKQDDRQWFVESLAGIGSEAAVLCPVGPKDQGRFDVSIVEPTSQSWQTFKEWKTSIDIDIAVRILGQNLTTEISDNGSRAASETHDLVRLDKAIEDALIGDAFRCQLLHWFCQYNLGKPEMAPAVKYHVEPAADLIKIATGWKTYGEGLTALLAVSPRVDVIALLEAEGVPLIDESEVDDEAPPADEVPPPQAPGEDSAADAPAAPGVPPAPSVG